MTKQEIFEFVTKNPFCSLATIDGNQPRVRIMMLYQANENGIIFTTTTLKDVYKQLQKNSAVEMCFFNAQEMKQVRIEGQAEVLDDLELKKQIVEKLPFLKPLIESKGYEVLVCYSLKNAKACPWTMEANFAPKQFINL